MASVSFVGLAINFQNAFSLGAIVKASSCVVWPSTLATITNWRRLVTTTRPYLLRYFATCSLPATVSTSSPGALISRTPGEGIKPSASGSSALDFWSAVINAPSGRPAPMLRG